MLIWYHGPCAKRIASNVRSCFVCDALSLKRNGRKHSRVLGRYSSVIFEAIQNMVRLGPLLSL